MGMKIDKCIWELKTMRAGIKCGLQYEETDEDKEIDHEQIDALNMAIDTMRKYQKIKKQVDIAIDKENFVISDARLIQIRTIINGDDD